MYALARAFCERATTVGRDRPDESVRRRQKTAWAAPSPRDAVPAVGGESAMYWRLAVITVVLGAVAAGRAEMLWDNFLTPPDGYDKATYISSEKNTTIIGSWAADDAVFSRPVTVTGIEWLAIRDPSYAYTAEVMILDDQFTPVQVYTGLPYQANVIAPSLFGLQAYDGLAQIPATDLLAGHYYFAARLTTAGAGANKMLSTGHGQFNGETMAAFQSDHFGLGWALLSDLGGPHTDLSYRIFGTPEPGALGLLAAGTLMLRSRRSAATETRVTEDEQLARA
jgi:hypothetical protein